MPTNTMMHHTASTFNIDGQKTLPVHRAGVVKLIANRLGRVEGWHVKPGGGASLGPEIDSCDWKWHH